MSALEAVELPRASWEMIHAVLLRRALELEADRRVEESTELMNSVVPVVGRAAGEETKVREQQVRERIGLPLLGSTVEKVPA